MKWNLRCPACGAAYALEPGRYLCDACGSANRPGEALHGVLECAWELEPGEVAPQGAPLPVAQEWFPPLPVGNTPLWAPRRVRAQYKYPGLWLKDDTCNPSGSYKDRASWLVAAFALERGISEIALASTGNAASSMACVGAAAGLRIKVFLPKAAPQAKRVQVLQYGAELVEVDGTYDLAFEQSLAYTRETGVLSRNTAYNPLTIEGKKTAAFEIVADLGFAPDEIFVPTGDGVILAGLIKGFEDLVKLREIDRMPRFWAAQAEGSSAIARALETGRLEPRPSDTLADSISVDAPRNGPFVIAKLARYRGRGITASDKEILDAQRELSAGSGLFAEPSSACAFACWKKARDQLPEGGTSVVMITGSGLKDIKNASRAVGLLP